MRNYDAVEAGILMEGMTSDQKLQFHREMTEAWRDPKKAARLKTWLGGIGAHHRYLGDTSRANKWLLFCWTGIPVLMTMFEGNIKKRTERINSEIAMRIAARIKGASPVVAQQYAAIPVPSTSQPPVQSSGVLQQPVPMADSGSPSPRTNFVSEKQLQAAPLKRNSSSVLKWALIGVGLVSVLSVGARLATRPESREPTAAQTVSTPTPQSSTVAAAGTVAEATGAKPAGNDPAQSPQPDGGQSRSALETCVSGGEKPELVCLSEELDRQDARLNGEYKRVMADYKQHGQDDSSASLRKIELEWIQRVKSECDTTPPGFIGNPDRHRIECRLNMTKSRADELAKMP